MFWSVSTYLAKNQTEKLRQYLENLSKPYNTWDQKAWWGSQLELFRKDVMVIHEEVQ